MRTNADCTIYNKSVNPATRSEIWTRQQVRDVQWENRKAANVIRSGMLEADQAAIYIPAASLGGDLGNLSTKPGDVIVKGLVVDDIDQNFTISDLKRKYPDVLTIRSVDRMDYGSPALQHWQIGAS